MDAITHMIFGDTENYRATTSVKAGQLMQLGTRGAVACADIAKDATGKVFVSGCFFFDCENEYEVEETEPVAYDFKRNRFAPIDIKGSLVFGEALFATPKGSKFIGLALSG